MQIAGLRRLQVLLQFIYGQGPEAMVEGEAVRCAANDSAGGEIYDVIVYFAIRLAINCRGSVLKAIPASEPTVTRGCSSGMKNLDLRLKQRA